MNNANNAMTTSSLETISDLGAVCGGVHDPGKCFEDVSFRIVDGRLDLTAGAR